MSLKNANLDKELLKHADNILNLGEDSTGIANLIKKNIDDIPDLGTLFGLSGTSQKTIREVLAELDVADSIDDVLDSMDKFNASRKGVDGLTTSFKNLGKGIKSAFKALATNPFVLLAASMMATKAIIDNYYEKYDKLVTAAEDSQGMYSSTASELKNLESEMDTVSAKITELENQGTLSVTDQAELDKLKTQNLELKRQYDLKQQLAEEQSSTATKDAMNALTLERTKDITQKTRTQSSSRHDFGTSTEYVNTNIVTAAQNEVAALAELRDKRKEYLTDDISDASQTKEFEALDAEIAKYETEITSHLSSLTSLRENFIDQTTGLVKNNLTAEELDMFNSISAIIDDYNNIDLSPAERELNKIKQFFDGSFGKNRIKDELLASSSSTAELTEKLDQLGISLDSIGIENIGRLFDYLNETKNQAKEATDSIMDYAASVKDLEAASETIDQDADWSTTSEKYKEAKELLKEGKTGTDNFQAMAKFLNPEKTKKELEKIAEEGGKYTADAYQKAFESVKETANRWFGEDETISMENFVNDFKKQDLFDVETDAMGLWDIETNFKTTAEAADKFGISIAAVETMLDALGAYGYEFDVDYSGKMLETYNSHVEGIKAIKDELHDSNIKERLQGILEEVDTTDFENNLEELNPEIVAKIEFEYDLAQIDLEIQKLQEKLASTGYSDATSNAELISSNEYRSNVWQDEHAGVKKDKGYSGLDTTISTMQGDLVGKSGEDLAALQRQIIAVQELRTAFENAYDVAEQKGETLDWEQYINSEQAKNEVQNLSDNLKVPIENFEELFDKEFSTDTHLQMEIGVSLSKEQVEEELKDLSAGSTIEFSADLNGVEKQVKAIKNEDGTITYTLVETGEEIDLNKEGTVIYRNAGQEPPVPQQTFVEYLMGEQAQPIPKDADLNYVYKSQEDPEDRTAYVTYKTREGGGTGQYLGTAHVLGTSSTKHPIPKYSTRALAMGSLKNSSWLKDDWKTAQDEVALTGELGQELVVSGNRWFTVGDNGAEFAHIPAGSVVFNHKQTEELLSKGHINSRGTAHLHGTAYRLGNYNDTGKSKTDVTVSTSSKTTSSVEDALDAIANWFDWIEVRLSRLARNSQNTQDAIERATTLAGTLSKTNTAIAAINKEQTAAEKGAARYLKAAQNVAKKTGLSKKYQEKVQNGTINIEEITDETTREAISEYQNWYEKYLSTLDKVTELEDQANELALSRLDKINEYYDSVKEVHNSLISANDAKLDYREAMGYSEVNNAQKKLLQSSLAEAKSIKSTAQQNLNKYQKEFNSQVAQGNLKKGSVEYNERLAELNNLKAAYYEASTAVIEHADALREIKYTKLDNAIEKFARASEKLQNAVDLAEARGEKVSESTYRSMMTQNNNEIQKRYEKRQEKLAEQSKYKVGGTRYQEIADEISTIDGEIVNLLIDNEKLKDSIVELRYDPLKESVENLQAVRSELDDFRDLINEEALFDSKTGELTNDGVASIYLIEQAMVSAKQEIAEYTKGLEINKEFLANNNMTQQEFNEKNAEYREGIRKAIKDVKSYADTLSDLYLNQMEKENELLQEIIEKRKEALKRKEDYYNYDKTLRNQTKDLNLLRAQAAALAGSTNTASQAELKRLKQQIADAEEELSETKRQHSVEMQEQGYDALSKNLDDVLADTELEIKTNAEKQLEIIKSMLQTTVSEYENAYSKINEIISQTGFIGSDDFNKAVSGIGGQELSTLLNHDFSVSDFFVASDAVKDIVTSQIVSDKEANKNLSIQNGIGIASQSVLHADPALNKDYVIPNVKANGNNSDTIILSDGSILTKVSDNGISASISGKLKAVAKSADLNAVVKSAEDIILSTVSSAIKNVNVAPASGIGNVSCHYDSLLTVNGDVDRAVLPELKEILKQSYQYTTQQMTKDALRAGNKLRR